MFPYAAFGVGLGVAGECGVPDDFACYEALAVVIRAVEDDRLKRNIV